MGELANRLDRSSKRLLRRALPGAIRAEQMPTMPQTGSRSAADSIIPFDAPFIPEPDEQRRLPSGWLPPRDTSGIVIPLPGGGHDVLF